MRELKEVAVKEGKELLDKDNGFRTDIKCPDCSGTLIVREGYSKFFGCSNYPKCSSKYGVITFSPHSNCVGAAHRLSSFAFEEDEFTGSNITEDYSFGIRCAEDIEFN